MLPELRLREMSSGRFRLEIGPGMPGLAEVALGLLRAMADDYGALVTLGLARRAPDGGADVTIRLLDQAHGEGRAFTLGQVE